jgi:hypothetical protein
VWWKVYVIELRDDPSLGTRIDVNKPHVYVGRTTRSREDRFKAHIREANGRGSRVVTKENALCLRSDLVAAYKATRNEVDANQMEVDLMASLRERGFTVHGSSGTPWMNRSSS